MDYNKKQYNIAIKDPEQPILISKAKKKTHEEANAKMIALLLELSNMTGLTDKMEEMKDEG